MSDAAQICIADVDIERMAEEQKISVEKIKAYLGVAPTTSSEAREAYLACQYNPAESAAMLQTWVSLCKKAMDFSKLLRMDVFRKEDHKLLRDELRTKLKEILKKEMAEATTFAEAFEALQAIPSYGEADESDRSAFFKIAGDKMAVLCQTSAEADRVVGHAWDHLSDRSAFGKKWDELCNTPEEIKTAFETKGRHVEGIVIKRISICQDKKELKKIWKLVSHDLHYEKPYILKMATFYIK